MPKSYGVNSQTMKRPPLSDEDIERVRSDVPDDPIRLPEGWLACRTCGVAVQRTSDMGEEIQVGTRGRMVEGPAVMTQAAVNQQSSTLSFMLCGDHQRTAELAEQIVPDPAQQIARYEVNCALDALSFIAPQTVEHTAYLDPEGLAALARHLTRLGSNARWVDRFIPVMTPEANPRTCTRYPFAHLMPGARQQLRAAYGALLRERVARDAPAVLVPPPRVTDLSVASTSLIRVEGGCLICGVGHQSASALQRPAHPAARRSLGICGHPSELGPPNSAGHPHYSSQGISASPVLARCSMSVPWDLAPWNVRW